MNIVELTKQSDMESLVALMVFTSALCYAGNWLTLDACLESIDVQESSPEGLVAMLRTTWMAKKHLPYWKTLLLVTHAELTRREMNADRILQGLLQL